MTPSAEEARRRLVALGDHLRDLLAGARGVDMAAVEGETEADTIYAIDKVFADPQVIHRGMRLDLPSEAAKGGTIPGVRTPIMLDRAPMASPRPAPRLGEHTQEILREIGEGS